jgi:hypothetical protein
LNTLLEAGWHILIAQVPNLGLQPALELATGKAAAAELHVMLDLLLRLPVELTVQKSG